MFTTQYIEITKNKQLITSGGLGTMGYGFPAAIGAKLGNPDKDVIAISGDGGMQMNIQEFATAVLEELPIAAAFEEAKKNTKTPTLIEFVINPEELVYPMVQPGGTLEDLIMDC